MEEAAENTTGNGVQRLEEYTLPSWRVNQIILEALSVLSEAEYYKEGFDYKQMIQSKGIKLKRFSSFAPENLMQFRRISLSLWNEGVCLIFPDEKTGTSCRMIAYNDNGTAAEVMQIIMHEFGHIRLHHTQQSINGEVEATCFALVMSLMLMLEEQFHIGKKIMQTGGKHFLIQQIQNSMAKKEVA